MTVIEKPKEDARLEPRQFGIQPNVIALAFPALATLLLAIGLYLVIAKDSQSPFAFGALGSSVVLFTLASVSIGYRLFGRTKAVPQRAPSAIAHEEAEIVALPVVKSLPAPPAKLVAKAERPPEGNGELAKLMNMTLGEILLAAHLGNPEGAGRIVAQAVTRAGKGTSPDQPRPDL